jgi:hypothetical protein
MKQFVIVLVMLLIFSGIAGAQLSLNTASPGKMVMTNLSAMPLAFSQNLGQWNEKALFKADAGGATFWFCSNEVALVFTRDTHELIEDGMPNNQGMPDKFNYPKYKKESMALYAKFIGANPNPEIFPEDRLGYNSNYFHGDEPSKWATDVPNYTSLTYKDIYPGIDLKYHGNVRGIKYDFIVNPGSDISLIKIKYEGADNLSIALNGELEATTLFGEIHENIPEIYQEINGHKIKISGRYTIIEQGVFGFKIEDYNPNYPLVIDPELVYSTYLGGNDSDDGDAIAVDGSGNAYVTGYTFSTNFPTQNPYQTDQPSMDIFITKLSPSGNSLVYSTYLGGNDYDEGIDIAVNGSGNAYITGSTSSTNFPTQNSYQTDQPGLDAFVTKLSPSGNSLVYSTYLGGNDDDQGNGIAVDGSGSAYITGKTNSTNFPTQNPYQTDQPDGDAFVTKLSPSGNSLVYSTYLGGSSADEGWDIAIDSNGNAYIAGSTSSTNFPTQDPYQTDQPDWDAFVTKLSPSGNSLVYSTYLGGNYDDRGYGVAVDGSGSAYATGYTSSTNFPTQNPYQTDQPNYDAFVTKFSPSGNSLIYNTYLGGE